MKLISNKSIIENTAIVQDDVVNYNTEIGNYTKIMDNSHIAGNMVGE